MLPIREVDRYLEHSPSELRDIVLQIRDLVLCAAPSATEAVRRRDILYYYAQRGGPVSAGICLVSVHKDHVRLAFIHGAFLPDPAGLLRGEPHYKRYVRLDAYDNAPWEAVQNLIAASASFDPRTLTLYLAPSPNPPASTSSRNKVRPEDKSILPKQVE